MDIYDTNTTSIFPVMSKHPALAVLLSIFAMATVWGNLLVIIAVVCRQNLHTPTGYLVLSLSVSDLIVGLGVMPLNVIYEMYDQAWLFSLAVCDLWHSLDVLASTASIWNLCVIAVDRCVAVSDPLNYPELMSVQRVSVCIALVWIGSSLIAFPAVAWWRSASPELYIRTDRCPFTDDTGYLVFSSLLSFYVPLMIIVGAYGRVYAIASKHQKSISEGRQPLPCNPSIYIRVHRGGRNPNSNNTDQSIQTVQMDSDQNANACTALKRQTYGSYQALPKVSNGTENGVCVNIRKSKFSTVSTGSSPENNGSSRRRRKARPSLVVRLLAKESKAAKTLGIVVGAFIACWMPFFVVNVLSGACGDSCKSNSDGFRLAFTIVTWLGHCNSFLNPIIYTCFNREFRDAFAYVLFCGRWTRRGRAYGRNRKFSHYQATLAKNYCAKKGLAKAIEGGLRVIVPQATNAEAVVVSTNVNLIEEKELDDDAHVTQETGSDQDNLESVAFT